jgi:maltose alpha-D-glucosyltransferase/alpha-amylase
MRNQTVSSLDQLRRGIERIPPELRSEANQLIGLGGDIIKRFRSLFAVPLKAKRIRCHGDFHLGEVLFTGKDFWFIDFEGEPRRPLGERRIKRSPLRDVAGMMRSFDYISVLALRKQVELGTLQEPDLPLLQPWAGFWANWVSAIYFKAYTQALGPSDLLPESKDQLAILLETQLLEKALQEVEYELNQRPQLLSVPLRALLRMLTPRDSK